DAEARPQQHLGRRGAEAEDQRRSDRLHLALEPLIAGLDLALRGRLVHAALASRLPLEMLHRVGDVGLAPVDARVGEALVEDAASGTDERVPLAVFAVARLLAHDHDARPAA